LSEELACSADFIDRFQTACEAVAFCSHLEAGPSSVGGKETPIHRIACAAIDSFIDIVNHRLFERSTKLFATATLIDQRACLDICGVAHPPPGPRHSRVSIRLLLATLRKPRYLEPFRVRVPPGERDVLMRNFRPGPSSTKGSPSFKPRGNFASPHRGVFPLNARPT
jgi:hypothetical protein